MTLEQRQKHYEKELSEYFANNQDRDLIKAMTDFQSHFKDWEESRELRESEEEFPKTRKLVNPKTGDIAICWGNKMHNWDGPALYVGGNKKQPEYYLYGISYSFEEWKEMKKQWDGLPWYKTPSILADAGTARN